MQRVLQMSNSLSLAACGVCVDCVKSPLLGHWDVVHISVDPG
jgi:hypothetical protein